MRIVLSLAVAVFGAAMLAAADGARSTLLCVPAKLDADLDDIQRSLASAALIPIANILPIQTPTKVFSAFCFAATNAFGVPDEPSNQRLLRAGEVKLLGSPGSVVVYDLGAVGASMFTDSRLTQGKGLGPFTASTLAVTVVLAVLLVATCGALIWLRQRWTRYVDERVPTVTGDDDQLVAAKTLHPVQDGAVFSNGDVRSVLEVFGVDDTTIELLESGGFRHMLQLRQLFHSGQLDDVLMDLDVGNTAKQRIAVACMTFSNG